MFTRKKLIVNTSLIFMAIAPIVLYAYEYGPDPGYTGAPGDKPSCIALNCHTGTLNPAGGSVKIVASGGTTYVPGQNQTISVTITDPTERKYGFQLAARVDSNPQTTQAGLFLPGADGYTQVLCADASDAPATGCTAKTGGTLEWVEHSLTGYSKSGTPPAFTYTFTWTPPATDVGPVTLYAAGNAVTGALVVTGTKTYTTTLQLTPSTGGGGATPTVTAVVNDASFTAPIAAGSWVAIFGTNLAPTGTSRKWNESTEIVNNRLPTSLDGTSVTVNGKPAVVEFIQPTQINIQPPDDPAVGPVPVVVTTAAGASSAFTVNLAAVAPGLFPATAPFVVAQHADNSYVTAAAPAKAGEVIILWGTGFGPADPAVPAGQVFSGGNKLANTVTATIGGQPATVDFAGVVGAGLVQINVRVPASISSGNAPVVLTVGGVTTQTTANMIAIQ